MKNLFTAFLKSLYNAEWLKSRRAAPQAAWSYFAILVFVVSVISALTISGLVYPELRKIKDALVSSMPDFEAKFNKGTLTIYKLPQPYIFSTPEKDLTIVVDTVTTSSVAITDYVSSTPPASIFITKYRIEVNEEGGMSRTQKWEKIPDETITRKDVTDTAEKILRPWLFLLMSFVLFIGLFIGFFVSKLYTIVVAVLVASVFARFTNRDITMRELFTIGLYAITLPTLISALFLVIRVSIPYVQFLALLAFMLAIVMSIKPIEEIEN